MIYEEISKENIVEKKLMYEEHGVPSEIACIQKCFNKRCDTVYEENTCRCIQVIQHSAKEVEKSQVKTGNYYSFVRRIFFLFF